MKKLSLLVFSLALLISAIPAFTQTIQPTLSPDRSVDYPRLARIDTLVGDYIRKGWVNGVVILVIHDGHVVQYKGYGYANIAEQKPMHRDDMFRIASQTKAIVSVGIMELWEEGKFTLDEPIADFLPAFREMRVLENFHAADTTYTTVPAKRLITFRDLLTHTSGLDYPLIGSKNMQAIYAKAGISAGLGVIDYDLRERMEVLARLPLVHQPGEKWTYGLNVDLLGCLVEVISGMNLEGYLRKRLFVPLGMQDTWFNVPAGKASRLVTVYREDSLHRIQAYTTDYAGIDPDYPLRHKRYFSGGAGLTSTAWDYAVFLQMLLNGGVYNGVRILSPRTVQLMTSNQLTFAYNGTDNFGLGFGITSAYSAGRQVRNEGSFGWGGYFGTTYWADPKAHLVCLVMTNENPVSHGELEAKVEQLIYESFTR
jgi:CubicO group peptidase (beta-lactamase class C family)